MKICMIGILIESKEILIIDVKEIQSIEVDEDSPLLEIVTKDTYHYLVSEVKVALFKDR